MCPVDVGVDGEGRFGVVRKQTRLKHGIARQRSVDGGKQAVTEGSEMLADDGQMASVCFAHNARANKVATMGRGANQHRMAAYHCTQCTLYSYVV